MDTQSKKPTWITLFSLCGMCTAALVFLVPLLRYEPLAQMAVTLIILVGLFDVIALWIQANESALMPPNSPSHKRQTAEVPVINRNKRRPPEPPTDTSDHEDAA